LHERITGGEEGTKEKCTRHTNPLSLAQPEKTLKEKHSSSTKKRNDPKERHCDAKRHAD
jgi:hypothetical protein